ncbi:hypothetical protein [Streptomyces marianii]|uniref:Uncharacterized protein n=1 Tax=Streptomyces marianii TaxID=1817406 RepID=A0A5R9EEH0_9ACTN|nr:hypothetical protein [Streptomyces marianii]TLQ47169.1 hypothetical protein FEF34_33155 [Streptomyces marianii]
MCVIVTHGPDGWDLGGSTSVGLSGPGAGASLDGGLLVSNADGMDQLAGYGLDKELSLHYKVDGFVNHENAINLHPERGLVRNSEGEPVWAVTAGTGVGIEAGAEVGLNHTLTCSFRPGCNP